jgi:hypothetical protein
MMPNTSTVEISERGKRYIAEAVDIDGMQVTATGRGIRIASIHDEDWHGEIENPEAVIAILKDRSLSTLRPDLFTFSQKVPHTEPKYKYAVEWDNVAALPINTYEDWWAHQLDNKTRNMVRKAEKKGVVLREVPFDDDLVRGISEIYNETPTRQGRPFWHYGKDLASVASENGSFLDRSIFIGAFFEERLIGFAKLVLVGQKQAGLMQILSMVSQRDKAPTNALIAESVRSCAVRGIPYLTYAKFAYGNKQHSSVAEFKQNNGFERMDLPRYYVPLTLLGRLALRLGLHHPIRERIPESVLARVRRIRSVWYGKRIATDKATA